MTEVLIVKRTSTMLQSLQMTRRLFIIAPTRVVCTLSTCRCAGRRPFHTSYISLRSTRQTCSDSAPRAAPSTQHNSRLLEKTRPIILRTTYGIAAEPNRQNAASGIAMATRPAAHGYSRRGNFGGSVFRCVFWPERYILQQKCLKK